MGRVVEADHPRVQVIPPLDNNTKSHERVLVFHQDDITTKLREQHEASFTSGSFP